MSQIRNDVFAIWPEREPAQLVDVVTRDEMMEQLAQMYVQAPTLVPNEARNNTIPGRSKGTDLPSNGSSNFFVVSTRAAVGTELSFLALNRSYQAGQDNKV